MAEDRKSRRSSPSKKAKKTLSSHFNERARGASEVEIKLLVPDNDRQVFETLESYFTGKGWVRLSRKGNHLLTRQLDTARMNLAARGVSLRVRGDCLDDDLDRITTADICVKAGTTTDPSGALRRGEYEARIKRFETVPLNALLRKYPKAEYPELHKALKGIKPEKLKEYFRIDCSRNRYVIELPPEETGLKGKRFVAELIMDDVAFVVDLPGRALPLIFHYDMEIECEALFEPCDYDTHPDAAKHVSDALTDEETDRALSAIKRHIQTGAGTSLQENFRSKAERGFAERRSLVDAFKKQLLLFSGCEDLHKRLGRDYGFVLKRHPLATHNPK